MPETHPIRILMIEDHTLLRQALARSLSAEPDLEIVGQCGRIREALEIIARHPVDLVLLDINLRSEQGGAFLNLVRSTAFTGKILVVTAGVSDREAAWLLSRGCAGIFLKDQPTDSLIDRIRSVARGDPQPDGVPARECKEPAIKKTLTPREREVLRYVCEGLANKEIAERLSIAESSVKSFLQQLFAKTGVRSRAQLVAAAIEQYWEQLGKE